MKERKTWKALDKIGLKHYNLDYHVLNHINQGKNEYYLMVNIDTRTKLKFFQKMYVQHKTNQYIS